MQFIDRISILLCTDQPQEDASHWSGWLSNLEEIDQAVQRIIPKKEVCSKNQSKLAILELIEKIEKRTLIFWFSNGFNSEIKIEVPEAGQAPEVT